jgi:hypothetical protein
MFRRWEASKPFEKLPVAQSPQRVTSRPVALEAEVHEVVEDQAVVVPEDLAVDLAALLAVPVGLVEVEVHRKAVRAAQVDLEDQAVDSADRVVDKAERHRRRL